MLRGIFDLFKGAEKIHSIPTPPKDQKKALKRSHRERLAAVDYQREWPEVFEDAVTLEIMDDPYVLKGNYKIDRATLEQFRKEDGLPIHPMTNEKIVSPIADVELKSDIETFVIAVVDIANALQKLREEQKPIEPTLLNETQDLTDEQKAAFLQEQKRQCIANLVAMKKEIIAKLKSHIDITTKCIRDRLELPEQDPEIERVLSGEQDLLVILSSELQFLTECSDIDIQYETMTSHSTDYQKTFLTSPFAAMPVPQKMEERAMSREAQLLMRGLHDPAFTHSFFRPPTRVPDLIDSAETTYPTKRMSMDVD